MSLYSWGANSYGQLSLNHKEDKLVPCKIDAVTKKPECITGGGGHTLAIIDGLVYSCGSNNKGQLGLGHRDDAPTLQLISELRSKCSKVTKVAGGWDFSLALTDAGEVYGWGSNAFGQLGTGDVALRDLPKSVCLEQKRILDIACGLRHSIFLTDSGEVLCCGAGRKGQLGFKTEKLPTKVDAPVKVTFPDGCGKVTQVIAGAYHSAAVTDKGKLLVWGDNKHGQCCVDPVADPSVTQPRCVAQDFFGNKTLSHVYSGWTHLLAKTTEGVLYSWGRNDYGQLGRPCSNQGGTFDHVPKPVPIALTAQVVCGSEHNIALLDTGDVMSWGWNEHGMCANGSEENVLCPKSVAALSQHSAQLIGSGHGHSLAFVSKQETENS